MEAVRDKWTDDRLDDLNKRVDAGFTRVDERFGQVDAEFRALRSEMNARFDHMDARFDAMQRTMAQGVVALSAAMIAGFAGVMGLLATQL
jgi:hypothetical protein